MSATTQVKGLSPVIIHTALGQGLHFPETNITTTATGEVAVTVSGSETVAGISYAFNGTWESLNVACKELHKLSIGAEEAMWIINIKAVGLTHSKGVGRVMSIELGNQALEGGSGLMQRGSIGHAIP